MITTKKLVIGYANLKEPEEILKAAFVAKRTTNRTVRRCYILSSSSLNWYSTIKTPFEALIKIELDDNLTMEEKIYVAFHVGRYLENVVG